MNQFSSTKVEGSEVNFAVNHLHSIIKTKALGKVGRPFDKDLNYNLFCRASLANAGKDWN